MTFTHALSTNNFGCAKFIVDGSAANGTHTTIASAITAASSGETIFIRPGTYTENLTMKAGVNLAAYDCDSFTPNVSIVGTLACSYSGTASISGIRLTTNSANIISLTGANATALNAINCVLNCTNNTGISSTGSNAASQVNLINCTGFLTTTGIAYHSVTNGSISFVNCILNNSGASTTASTCSGTTLAYRSCSFGHVVTTSGATANLLMINSQNDCSGINTTAINANATFSTPNQIVNSRVSSGTATPISIGASATCVIANSSLDSSNATAVTGSGTLVYSGIVHTSTVGALAATTLTPKFVQGALNSTAPAAGMIGEQIRSAIGTGSAVSLTTGTGTNVTSISLTAGIWDVSGIVMFGGGAITGTIYQASISTTSATNGTKGDNFVEGTAAWSPTAAANTTLTIPSFRLSLAATTTVYLVTAAAFTVGTVVAYGRISATRVA